MLLLPCLPLSAAVANLPAVPLKMPLLQTLVGAGGAHTQSPSSSCVCEVEEPGWQAGDLLCNLHMQ